MFYFLQLFQLNHFLHHLSNKSNIKNLLKFAYFNKKFLLFHFSNLKTNILQIQIHLCTIFHQNLISTNFINIQYIFHYYHKLFPLIYLNDHYSIIHLLIYLLILVPHYHFFYHLKKCPNYIKKLYINHHLCKYRLLHFFKNYYQIFPS